jgi:hypothetical protein
MVVTDVVDMLVSVQMLKNIDARVWSSETHFTTAPSSLAQPTELLICIAGVNNRVSYATRDQIVPVFKWALLHETVPGIAGTSAVDGGEWSASRPSRFNPKEKPPPPPPYPQDWRLWGSQRSDKYLRVAVSLDWVNTIPVWYLGHLGFKPRNISVLSADWRII